MIYVVSGYMRSGTSMMMKCLEAGGLETVFEADRDRVLKETFSKGSYVPNEQFYELEAKDRVSLLPHQRQGKYIVYGSTEDYMQSDDFTNRFRSAFDGKAIKLVFPWLWALPCKARAKVVVMTRNPAEINESLNRFTGFVDRPGFAGWYRACANQSIDKLKLHHHVQVLDYSDVIENPYKAITSLNWPIDASKAAAIVDPKLYRNRAA